MANIGKFFVILESLQFSAENKNNEELLGDNLATLRKYIKTDINELLKELKITENDVPSDPEWTYCVYIYSLLTEFIKQTNFNSDLKEDLLSTCHINCCIEAVKNVAIYGLRRNIHPIFQALSMFSVKNDQRLYNNDRLLASVEVFSKIIAIKQFHIAGSLNLVIRDYIASIFSIFSADLIGDYILTDIQRKELQQKLNSIWNDISKSLYFRNILLLKGIPKLPESLQKRLHKELMDKLMCPKGFQSFIMALMPTSGNQTAERPQSEYCEVIAGIVAHKGHSQQFYENLITQIFRYLHLCLIDNLLSDSMGIGLLTLNRLYKIRIENRQKITQELDETLQKLIAPLDILSGLIVMDHAELEALIKFIFTSFCISSVECLPSELLVRYLPLFLNIYSYLPDDIPQKIQIRSVIVRCLDNRTRDHLKEIINNLLSRKYPSDWKDLHQRLILVPNQQFNEITIKICSPGNKEELSISNVLPEILMKSKHNILTYNVFIALLEIMEKVLIEEPDDEANIDLLQTEKDLITFLNAKYPVKVEVILTLSSLVTDQSLKSHIAENSTEFLKSLRRLIESRSSQTFSNRESTDHTLLLMLTITQEMLENSQFSEKSTEFITLLGDLKRKTPNVLVQHRIGKILVLLEGGTKEFIENRNSEYNSARELMKEKENHLKVYGINLMINLLRRRDTDALANCHITIALALHALREPESYTFLNCVRLFVELVNVIESEVIETLSHEYLNKDADYDYRLVVGETILKVSKELGTLCYKYKEILINCFMHGSRSSNDEFRWSSFSNLATLCRILSYQVQTFFQELLALIENELAVGKYIPAKRAATLVLSELIQGIENLVDFEDCLKPIYKLLKSLEENESCDEKIRLHAAFGLQALTEKCKSFLFPKQRMIKEIKIIGINESETKKRTGSILELN